MFSIFYDMSEITRKKGSKMNRFDKFLKGMTTPRKVVITRGGLITGTLLLAALLATPLWAAPFFFSTGSPNGQLGALSRRPSPGKMETETADDFVLTETTVIKNATITGLIPVGMPLGNITEVEVEVYHVFPLDSDIGRTSGPPMFSTAKVPTRNNSPSDVEIDTATRSRTGGTLETSASVVSANFMVSNTVVNNLSVKAGGEGPFIGEEVEISITFTSPIVLPAGHYFFRPEVLVTNGDFFYLSGQRPLMPAPFAPELQAWIRNTNLLPDWLRIGTDIIAGTTFNMAFSLTGETVPDLGTPGQPNCHGQTISALAHQFGGINAAASTLGFSSVKELQRGFSLFCE
jgi:hypothetical protein